MELALWMSLLSTLILLVVVSILCYYLGRTILDFNAKLQQVRLARQRTDAQIQSLMEQLSAYATETSELVEAFNGLIDILAEVQEPEVVAQEQKVKKNATKRSG